MAKELKMPPSVMEGPAGTTLSTWGDPKDMIGSWAGAMGHTQWMPEVWLHMGVDFDGDGHISPYGRPDDALAGTARYILERGKY